MSRKELLKVYHGIPNTPMDDNTVLYASFNRSLTPEVGLLSDLAQVMTFGEYCPTGNSITRKNQTLWQSVSSPNIFKGVDIYTVDCWIKGAGCFRISNSDSTYGLIARSDSVNIYGGYAGDVKQFNTGYSVNDYVHVRVIYNSITGLIKIYANGNIIANEVVASTCRIREAYNLYLLDEFTSQYPRASFISDLHVSNIDRGDYFHTLPKDFCKGKAIIRPRMGQQQIKGDPVYGQETVLHVVRPSVTDTFYIVSQVAEDNGYYRSLLTPELSYSHRTIAWLSNSGFKIKGLNGEVIGGVIDTDTALAKVISNTTTTLVLDSVSGLSVGDTFKLYNPVDKTTSADRTVTNIDIGTNTVTFSGSALGSINSVLGWFLIENTTTSSAPVVKSQKSGITVVGTWTGLGTNEATFKLGTNSDLQLDEDLYVAYSLTIPPNNSDYPTIPYSIEHVYDEFGNELKPASSIILEDDFKGKVALSDVVCPHKMYTHRGDTLKKPTDITGNLSTGFQEFSLNSTYESLMYLDGNTRALAGESTTRPQQLVTFNILEILERKIGEIPSLDKIGWIKSNISNITLNYNVGSTSNVYVQAFISNAWKGSNTHIGGVQPGTISVSQISEAIQPNGCVHFLIFGELNSTTIYIDYLKINVTLKLDTTYTTYFTSNVRAREYPCNPVLIQKETKTVKRYFPSNECFSTEILYSDPKPTNGDLGNNIIYSYPLMFITTQGTGSFNNNANDYFRECLAKLGFTKYSPYDFTNDVIINYKSLIGVDSPTRFQTVECDSYFAVNRNNIPKNFDFKGNFVALKPTLINVNNEVVLNVYARVFKNGVSSDIVEQKNYKLPNRPLIK